MNSLSPGVIKGLKLLSNYPAQVPHSSAWLKSWLTHHPHLPGSGKEDLEGKHPMDMAGKSSLPLTAHWPELSHMAFLWPQVRLGNVVYLGNSVHL